MQVEEEKAKMRELEAVKRHLDGETDDLQNQVGPAVSVTGTGRRRKKAGPTRTFYTK